MSNSGRIDEAFTTKCKSSAQISGFALVRTQDLFAPAGYLEEHKDGVYATACRAAILNTKGDVVVFPPVPKAKS